MHTCGMWGAAVRWNVADFSAVTVFWDTTSQSLSTCFLFNLRCKFTFYDIQFRRYTIVTNSAILSLQDIKIPVLHTPTLVARQFLRAYIYAFHIPKVFSVQKTWSKFPGFCSTIKLWRSCICSYCKLNCLVVLFNTMGKEDFLREINR